MRTDHAKREASILLDAAPRNDRASSTEIAPREVSRTRQTIAVPIRETVTFENLGRFMDDVACGWRSIEQVPQHLEVVGAHGILMDDMEMSCPKNRHVRSLT